MKLSYDELIAKAIEHRKEVGILPDEDCLEMYVAGARMMEKLLSETNPDTKVLKTFDCQWNEPKMPDDAKKELFNNFEGVGNDVYVDWDVGECGKPDGPLNTWLREQGCEDGEDVVIKYWW